jgi:hypothetical protein
MIAVPTQGYVGFSVGQTVGKSIGLLSGTGAAAPLLPLRIITNQTYNYGGAGNAAPSNANADAARSSIWVPILQTGVTEIVLENYKDQITAGSQGGVTNDLTIRGQVVQWRGKKRRITRNGSNSVTMTSDTEGYRMDALSVASFGEGISEIPKGEFIKIETDLKTDTKGDFFVGAIYDDYPEFIAEQSISNPSFDMGLYDLYDDSADVVSDIMTPGDFTFTTGSRKGFSGNKAYTPLVLGRTSSPKSIAPVCFFDSIGHGYSARFSELYETNFIPMLRFAVTGSSIAGWNLRTNWTWVREYFDIVIPHIIANDLGGASAGIGWWASTGRPRVDTFNAWFSDYDEIHWLPSPLAHNSTDDFLTLDNDTRIAKWDEIHPQFVAYLESLVTSTAITSIFDVSPIRTTNTDGDDVYVSDGTTVHYIVYDDVHTSDGENDSKGTGSLDIADSGIQRVADHVFIPKLNEINYAAYGSEAILIEPTSRSLIQRPGEGLVDPWLNATWRIPLSDAPDAPTITPTAGTGQVTIAFTPADDGGMPVTDRKVYYRITSVGRCIYRVFRRRGYGFRGCGYRVI